MERSIQISILIIFTLHIIGCSVSTSNFPEPNKLKIAIAESIEIPFKENHNVIYNSRIGICGNSSKDELYRHYEPQLDKSPYSKILTDNYEGKVWFTGDELHQMMDSVCQSRNEAETVWDCFSKNKIRFSILGKAITNNSVEIHERYFLNNKIHSIDKIFEYKNGLWDYQITQNE